jgi:hypothetical protein
VENALALSNLQEFYVFVARGPSYLVFCEANQVNFSRPDLKIRVFGLFHPFPTPETPLEQPQPVFPNATHPKEGRVPGIVGIPCLRAELLAADSAREVLKNVIFTDLPHF